MASEEERNYSPEFKREVAQQALNQSKRNLDDLSEKYDVPVSVILMWATELEKGGPDVFERTEEEAPAAEPEQAPEIDIDVGDSEIAEGFSYGVMKDRLNYRRLIFWSILGVILISIFVQALMEMNSYNIRITKENHAAQYDYSEVKRIKQQAREQLNSFGVVSLEENIFRIPVDSAISDIASDAEN